jgi:hypothetical protein
MRQYPRRCPSRTYDRDAFRAPGESLVFKRSGSRLPDQVLRRIALACRAGLSSRRRSFGQAGSVERLDGQALALAPARDRHHDITGSQSLGLDAIAAAGTREWGTPLTYVNITPGEHCVEMAAAGEDPWWMYAYSTMFASIRGQRWVAVSGEVRRLTGRPPTPIRTALARYKTV